MSRGSNWRDFKVNKWFDIISLAVFVLSLPWLFVAYNLPDEVEQKATLVEYEHQGRFDYLVYLKPSHLFGPPPQEPLPNSKYPAELVDTIDFSFSYSAAELAPEIARIEAVLENPGIWQKRIELASDNKTSGDFTLRFSLDIREISELFNDIEEEIEITSSPHCLTIRAYVINDEEQFVQSLPIRLSKTLVEVDGNRRHTQSSGVGELDYTVNLKENSIFDEKSLKPPPVPVVSSYSTLKPGQVVFSKLVDSMDVTFNYRFRSDKPVNSVTADVEITTTLEATKLWSKSFQVLYTKNTDGDFEVSFPLDLVYYLDLLDTIRTETGAAGESNIIVNANVYSTAETEFGLIEETFSQSMKGTLKGSILEWDGLEKTQPGSIEETRLIPNPNKYLGLSVSGIRILSTTASGILLLIFLFFAVLYVRFKPAELSPIEKETQRVSKKYRQIMAEATSQTPIEGEKVISLDSIEDLVTVANELGKPVIHQAPGDPENFDAYYVFDGAARYQYVLVTNDKEVVR